MTGRICVRPPGAAATSTIAFAFVVFGCHGGRLADDIKAPCASDTECRAPYVCEYGRCRTECETDADCADGACVPAAAEERALVCLPEERCEHGRCAEGLHCAADGVCHSSHASGKPPADAGPNGPDTDAQAEQSTGVSVSDATVCTPIDDGKPCTDDICLDDMPAHRPAAAGTACASGGTRCDGFGTCVECLVAEDCAVLESMCRTATCIDATCSYRDAPTSTPCDDSDACTLGDTCEAGACIAGNPIECRGARRCAAGTCVAPECNGILGLPAPPLHLPGGWPGALETADFNDDSRPDLAVATGTGFTVLLNHPQGGFTLDGPYPGGGKDLAAGDLNGDGLPDIASVSQTTDVVNVALNQGDATFAISTDYRVASIPSAVVMSDLNRDGALDLAVATSGADGIDVLLNQGDGTLSSAITYPAGRYAFALSAADLNADGLTDVAAVNLQEYTLSVLLNEGAGVFAAPRDYATGVSPYAVAAADLNGDALPELVVANHGSNDVAVFVNQGTGTFVPRATFGVGRNPIDLALEDFDGDGLIDLAVADSNGDTGVSILLNRGDASFDPPLQHEVGGLHPRGIVASDFDGDTRVDLAVANSSSNDIGVLSSEGDGVFGPPRSYGLGPYEPYSNSHPESVAVGDLNGDPFADVVVSSRLDNAVTVMLNDGTPWPRLLGPFAVGESPETVVLADLNGDGTRDVAATNRDSGSVSVLLNRGSPTSPAFEAAVPYPAGTAPLGLAAADLNGDQRPELIVTNYGDATVSVLGNLGDGSFGERNIHAAGTNPYAVTAANLDEDGDLDVVTANLYGSNVSVLLNDGRGALGAPTHYAAGEGAESVVAADLDGDGRLDLAVANELSRDITILFNEGDGRFRAPARYPAGPGPASIAAADLDGDQDTDLAVANQYGTRVSTLVSVFLNRGEGTFDPALHYYRVGANPRSIAAADMDFDGRPDLVVANGNAITVMLNACLPEPES